MGFLIGLLTIVMVLDCLVLMFLVLIQLPKKEAGAGLAFGGAASDALFGAGSGTVLTKITKYAAGIFFVLALVLSVMQRSYHTRTTSAFEAGLKQAGPPPGLPAAPAQAPLAPPAKPAPETKPAAAPGTNTLRIVPPPVEDTNLPLAIPAPPAAPAPTNK
jgi:preprotein translocase subunit SecG